MDVDGEIIPKLEKEGLLTDISDVSIEGNNSYPVIGRNDKYPNSDFETHRVLEPFGGQIFIQDGDIESYPRIDRDTEYTFKTHGIEALAWYNPFHFYKGNWGINILDKGLYFLAEKCQQEYELYHQTSASVWSPPSSQPSKPPLKGLKGFQPNKLDFLHLSYAVLFFHEYFHFITEIASTSLELRGNLKKRYQDYIENVFSSPVGRDEPLEEALANSYAHYKFGAKFSTHLINRFMDEQPNGYRAYGRFRVRTPRFKLGKRLLASYIAAGSKSTSGTPPLEVIFDTSNRYLSYSDVPVRIVTSIKDSKFIIKCIPPRIQHLVKSDPFSRDLKKLPQETRFKVERELDKLRTTQTRRPKRVWGCDTIYKLRLRVGGNYGISIKPDGSDWVLVRCRKWKKLEIHPI